MSLWLKKPNKLMTFLIGFMVYLLGGFPILAYALPQGGQIVAGQGNIQMPSHNDMVVNQSTGQMIANWQGFSVAAPESVTFNQPNASAVALNRVVGVDPSVILGKLSSNGQIFLTNPSGIIFGHDARVNVGGLTASTLNITNRDFLEHNYTFSQDPNRPLASILNQGRIQSSSYVGLLAPRVENQGAITANLGSIALSSGEAATLDFSGDGLINFKITEGVKGQVRDSNGNIIESGVINSGLIRANGGQIILSTQKAYEMVHNVVNNSGIIEAKGVVKKSGRIYLVGADDVENSGTLDASGKGSEETGGTIQVLGNRIHLAGGTIDVSGSAGGGTALIGGDYQGKNPAIQNATSTTVGADAAIHADALVNGNGGKVIVWADNAARVYGTITARGGAEGGNGGFVETSGKNFLVVAQAANVSAPRGLPGNWLLDPLNVELVEGVAAEDGSQVSVLTINEALDNGTNVTVSSPTEGIENGNITVSGAIVKSQASGPDTTLTLDAIGNILVNNTITAEAGTLNVALTAGGAVNINSAIDTNGGNLTVASVYTGVDEDMGAVIPTNDIFVNASIDTNGGAMSLTADDSIEFQEDVTTNAGSLTLNAMDIRLEGITNVAGAASLTAGNNIKFVELMDATTEFTSETLTAVAANNLEFDGSTSITGGENTVLTADSDNSGQGDLIVKTGGSFATGSEANGFGSLTVTAQDISLSGPLSSGDKDTTIMVSVGNVGLGSASCGGSCGMSLDNDDLGHISAKNLTVSVKASGSIFADDVEADATANIANNVELDATADNSNITFTGQLSTFSNLKANASNGINVLGPLTIISDDTELNADSDGNGQGDLTFDNGGGISTGDDGNEFGSLTIIANEIINLEEGFLNSGDADMKIVVSDDGSLGLGDANCGGTCGMSISGDELQNITAASLTLDTAANIFVDNVSAANSNNISGLLTLNATADNGRIAFYGSSSTFNALTANADDGITIDASLTADSGNLTLEGDFDNAADTNDNIAIGPGLTLTSAGAMTLDATGGIEAAGAATLNATGGITINDNFASTGVGAITIDADTDKDGMSDFTLADGKTLDSNNNDLTITANDIFLDGSLDSGSGNTSIFSSGGGDIGLIGAAAGTGADSSGSCGGVNCGLTLSGSELQNITAANLNIGFSGNTAPGNIIVDGITAEQSANFNGLKLGILDPAIMASVSTLNFQSDLGTALNFDDDDHGEVDLNFNFSFYGASYDEININSNGNLTFGGNNGAFVTSDLLAAGLDIIAPLNGDFDPSMGGNVFFNDTVDGQFSVTWSATPEFIQGGSNTFQATLFEGSNMIRFAYNGLTTDGTNWNNTPMETGIATSTSGDTGSQFIVSASGSQIPALDQTNIFYVWDGQNYVQNMSPEGIAPSPSQVNFVNNSSTFNALDVEAANGVNVQVDVTTTAGDLVLDGDVNNTAGATDQITIADGVTLASAGGITLETTKVEGAATLNADSGVTLNGDFTSSGAGAITINADADGNGTSDFALAAGKTLDSNNNDLTITANDLMLNGSLNTGAADTTLLVSDMGSIGLGDANCGGACGMSISGGELKNITAANLNIGDNTAGSIFVDSVKAADSNNISGMVTLNATKLASSITFGGTASIFNALTANADGGITINDITLATDAGNMTLNTNGKVSIASDNFLVSAGNITLNATDGIEAAGDVTLRAASGIAINDDFTSGGTIRFNADSDQNGTSDFILAAGKTVNSNNNGLTIIANDLILDGFLNSGSGNTTILVSDGGEIGLIGSAGTGIDASGLCGGLNCGMTISGSELQHITAQNLTISFAANSIPGTITVSGISEEQSANVNVLKLGAPDPTETFKWETNFGINVGLFDDSFLLDDDGSLFVDLGFDFNFYENTFSGVFINADGNLTFKFPNGNEKIIAPLFGDFDPSSAGSVFFNDSVDGQFTVTWSSVPEFGEAGANTFQTTLFEDSNDIQFAYNGLTTDGINGDGTDMDIGISSHGIPNSMGDLFVASASGSRVPGLDQTNIHYIWNGQTYVQKILPIGPAQTAHVNFVSSPSVFKALEVEATDGIHIGPRSTLTTTVGDLSLNSDSNNAADTNDKITIANHHTLVAAISSARSLTLTGDVEAEGNVTLLAASGITINDNFTANGTVHIDADSDADGMSDFTLAAGKTLNTNDHDLFITANDLFLDGSLNSGINETFIFVSDGENLGLIGTVGSASGPIGMTISGEELQRISAANLILGTNGGIFVDGISGQNSANIGTVKLLAVDDIIFGDHGGVFNALFMASQNTIIVNSDITAAIGDLTAIADSDNNGAGAFTLVDTASLFVTGGDLSITGNGINLNGRTFTLNEPILNDTSLPGATPGTTPGTAPSTPTGPTSAPQTLGQALAALNVALGTNLTTQETTTAITNALGVALVNSGITGTQNSDFNQGTRSTFTTNFIKAAGLHYPGC